MSATATLVNNQLQVIQVKVENEGENLITLITTEDYQFLKNTNKDTNDIKPFQILKNISKKLGVNTADIVEIDNMEVQNH